MFEFNSQPIALSSQYILCKDGSVWEIKDGDEFVQIASTKKRGGNKASAPNDSDYSDGFNAFWTKWTLKMRGQNPSPKQDSYRWWCKLSSQECLQAINCIEAYRRTGNEVNYLKRANTYLKEKMWESLTTVRQQPKAEVMPDMNVNLRGAF